MQVRMIMEIMQICVLGDLKSTFTCFRQDGYSIFNYGIVWEGHLRGITYFHAHDLKCIFANS